MELLLDGFEDDGHRQAEAALFNASFARFAAFERARRIGQGGLHLFEVDDAGAEEGAKVGDVAVALNQQGEQAPLAGGGMDFFEGQVGRRMVVNDTIDQEREVGVGAELYFHFSFVLLWVRETA